MLKGCHKSVVFLKDTGSELFDEAYFVVKTNIKATKRQDIVTEATMLANGFLSEAPRKRRLGWLLPFTTGAILGFCLMLALHFIF